MGRGEAYPMPWAEMIPSARGGTIWCTCCRRLSLPGAKPSARHTTPLPRAVSFAVAGTPRPSWDWQPARPRPRHPPTFSTLQVVCTSDRSCAQALLWPHEFSTGFSNLKFGKETQYCCCCLCNANKCITCSSFMRWLCHLAVRAVAGGLAMVALVS